MNVRNQHIGEDKFCDIPGGIRLCYRCYGPESAVPVILIAGLALQLTSWPESLINYLVDRGFRVITLDNRDAGRSTRVNLPAPGLLRQMLRLPHINAYDLSDMASDVAGLMDYLRISHAHLVGMSMGGMIAQQVAALHPLRVLSLTSIFSTTGARHIGQPALSTLLLLAKAPPATREDAMAHHVRMVNHVGSRRRYPVSDEALRQYAGDAWDRGQGAVSQKGTARHIGAIIKSGDRTGHLRRVVAPTLVIHGDVDLLVAPSGGQATAAAIKNAELITIHDMGHFISDGVVPLLSDLMVGHMYRSSAEAMNIRAQERRRA